MPTPPEYNGPDAPDPTLRVPVPEPLELDTGIEDRTRALASAVAAVQRPVDWDTWLRGLLDVEVIDLAATLSEYHDDATLGENEERRQEAIDAMRTALAVVLRQLETRTTEGLRR